MSERLLIYLALALVIAVIVRLILIRFKKSAGSKSRRVAVLGDVLGVIQSPKLVRGKVAHKLEVKYKHPRTLVSHIGYSEEITTVPVPLPEKVRVYVDLADESNYSVELKKV